MINELIGLVLLILILLLCNYLYYLDCKSKNHCPKCSGYGFTDWFMKCKRCNGLGTFYEKK